MSNEFEVKCDKYKHCEFRRGKTFLICQGNVFYGEKIEKIDCKYCAFYRQVEVIDNESLR